MNKSTADTNQRTWVKMVEGVERRILTDGEKLMMVEFHFQAGSAVAAHKHPHEQALYVVSGRLQFTLDGHITELSAGQSIFIPSNVVHGAAAPEETFTIEAFSPPREDFR